MQKANNPVRKNINTLRKMVKGHKKLIHRRKKWKIAAKIFNLTANQRKIKEQ